MIRLKLWWEENPVLVFGLSPADIEGLRRRRLIKFDLAELGIRPTAEDGRALPSIRVIIMSGKDEESIRAGLAEWFEMPGEDS